MIIGMTEMRIPPRGTAQRTCTVDGVACPLAVSVIHGLPAENPARVWSSWSGFLVLRGTGSWQVDGAAEQPLSPGCFGQHPIGRWHRIRRSQPTAWVEVSLRCPRVLYLHLVAAGLLPAAVDVVVPGDPEAALAEMLRLKAMLADRCTAIADCLAQLAAVGAAVQRSAYRPGLATPAAGLEQARRDLADDVMVTIDLKDYARRLGLSYAHFRRTFTRAAGVPPAAWRTRHRLEYARHLLVDRGMTVAAAADAVGYGSATAFSRGFTRTWGICPSACVG